MQSNEEMRAQSQMLTGTDGVEINEINFPDTNFRGYVSEQFDSDKDGSLSEDEIKEVFVIDVSSGNIFELTGIEDFTSLRNLACYDNCLKSLDISKNIELQQLSCGKNQLTSLDVSKNTKLQQLSCEQNQLTSLDLSENIELQMLWCDNNRLINLDVSKNTDLQQLDCNQNQLTSLNLGKNT